MAATTIKLKPLSVNEAYTGRRFKTEQYKHFKRSLLRMLIARQLPPPPYEIHLTFGLSSPLADYDGPIKATQDVICERYRINDRYIFKGVIEKVQVAKGAEFITFNIVHYEPKG